MHRLTALLAALAAAVAVTACGGDDNDGGSGAKTASAAPKPVAGAPAAYTSQPPAGGTTQSGSGTVVAKTDFDIKTDGFSFRNYGKTRGEMMRAQEVREIFGDGVCVDPSGGSCVLTPEAERWRVMQNANWSNGHCFGFSTLSLQLKNGVFSPSMYGGASTWSLQIANRAGDVINPDLDADLTRAAAEQTLASVQRRTRRYTPTQLVQTLRDAFNGGDQSYVLSFFMPGEGGHAVVPIAVEDMGGGRFDIVLYDNNFPYIPGNPEESNRRFRIDTNADSWEYVISTRPDVPQDLWKGEGMHNRPMLTKLADLGIPQPCPFCDDSGAAGRTTVALAGDEAEHGHLRITDAEGRVSGWDGSRFVNRIPGARRIDKMVIQRQLVEPEPYYELPAGGTYEVELVDVPDGARQASINASGPDVGVGVTGVTEEGTTLRLGGNGSVSLDGRARSLSVATPGDRELKLVPSSDRVAVVPAGGDVRVSGRFRSATATNPSTGRTAKVRRSGTVDLGSLVGSAK